MSDGTPIEWTDATLNVVNGCSVVSPGCTNCYAMRSGGRNLPNHPATGLTKPSKAGHVWTGEVRFNEKALLLPLRWKRPRKIFWNAHGDLFHENVPDAWIDRCFAVMALTPRHVHQVLTKRPERMRDYLSRRDNEADRPIAGQRLSRAGIVWEVAYRIAAKDFGREETFTEALRSRGVTMDAMPWPLRGVWLGVSVEDQQRADERIPVLLNTPAAVRWLSCEPLLGPVELDRWLAIHKHWKSKDSLPSAPWHPPYPNHWYEPQALVLAVYQRPIHWVVAGGESGPGARPMHPDWARSLRDQCAAASVPFLFKQWGEWADAESWMLNGGLDDCYDTATRTVRVGKKRAGRLLDGVQHDGYPA